MTEEGGVHGIQCGKKRAPGVVTFCVVGDDMFGQGSCFFVYEHAHLTADYRGRDLASLRHRRMGKANSHGYLLLSVLERKDR